LQDYWRQLSANSSIVACRTANPTSFLRPVVGSASLLSATAIFWRLALLFVCLPSGWYQLPTVPCNTRRGQIGASSDPPTQTLSFNRPESIRWSMWQSPSRSLGYGAPRMVFPFRDPHVAPPDGVKWKMGPTLPGFPSRHPRRQTTSPPHGLSLPPTPPESLQPNQCFSTERPPLTRPYGRCQLQVEPHAALCAPQRRSC